VQAIVLSDLHPDPVGHVSSCQADWHEEVKSQFSNKWGVSRLQDRVNILDTVLANDGGGIVVSPDCLILALDRIKGKAKLDHYGISVDAIKIAAIAQPSLVASFLSLAVASTAIMSSIVVKGRVFGKESSTTPAASLR